MQLFVVIKRAAYGIRDSAYCGSSHFGANAVIDYWQGVGRTDVANVVDKPEAV